MAEYRDHRVSRSSEVPQQRKLFLVHGDSPAKVLFAVDRTAPLKLVPGPAWLEQDGRRTRIDLVESTLAMSQTPETAMMRRSGTQCLPPDDSTEDGLSPSQFRR